jgi:hypothetical protein
MNQIRIRNAEIRIADPDLNPEGQLIFNRPDPEHWFKSLQYYICDF